MVTSKRICHALLAVIVTATVLTSCRFNQNQLPEQTNEDLRWYFEGGYLSEEEGEEILANFKLSPSSLATLYDEFLSDIDSYYKEHSIDYSTFSTELKLTQKTFLESGTWKLIKEGSTENTLANVPEGYDIQRKFIGNAIVESTQLPGDERPTEASRDCLIDDAHLKLTEQNGYVTEEYILSLNAFEMLIVIPKFNNYRLYRNETMKWASQDFLDAHTLPDKSTLKKYAEKAFVNEDYFLKIIDRGVGQDVIKSSQAVDSKGMTLESGEGAVYFGGKPFSGYITSTDWVQYRKSGNYCECVTKYESGWRDGYQICFQKYNRVQKYKRDRFEIILWKSDFFLNGTRVGRNNYYRHDYITIDRFGEHQHGIVARLLNVAGITVDCQGICTD